MAKCKILVNGVDLRYGELIDYKGMSAKQLHEHLEYAINNELYEVAALIKKEADRHIC